LKDIKKKINLKRLHNLNKKIQKRFWTSIRNITKQKSLTPQITSTRWIKYFKDLLNISDKDRNDNHFLNYIETSLPLLEREAIPNEEINKSIAFEEVEFAIKSLKNNKAAGPDRILNEMIKNAGKSFFQLLQKLFNKILTSNHYPRRWKKNMLTTIHKSGDINMPTNYRGIAIASNIHKIFTKIVNTRIKTYMTKNNKWSPNQNGFMDGRRTEDNITILHSAFNKYVRNSRQKLYLAFVDFRKYFDTINREFLMYKLLKNNITGNIYHVIKEMYHNSEYCIKMETGITDYIISNSGVLQGCNLSPTLSNIFQNDLHKIFESENTDPINLADMPLNSLSWADDLLLMSTSQRGLQTCLTKLDDYCKKWGLSINISKTKIMTMQQGPQKSNHIPLTLDNHTIEEVTQFKYLGFIIQHNGTFVKTIDDRIDKAMKCSYIVRNAIGHQSNVSVQLAMSIFQKQVSPILLYGCSIWAAPKVNTHLNIRLPILNWFANKQIQQTLDDIMNETIPIERSVIFRDENRILLKLKSWEDKQKLLCWYNKTPTTLIIYDHGTTNQKQSYEKVQNKFIKFALGLPKTASTSACLQELGQYPLFIKAYLQCILYYQRLESLAATNSNVLLNAAYCTMKQYNHPWIGSIHYLLAQYGFDDLFRNISLMSKNYIKQIVKTRLQCIHEQECRSNIRSKSFLYPLYKSTEEGTYKCQNYLNWIDSPAARMTFTRIRTNCSKLSTNPYSPIDKQCSLCKETLSIDHILLECPKNDCQRTLFLNKMRKIDGQIDSMPHEELIIKILGLNFELLHPNLIDEAINITTAFVNNTYLTFVKNEGNDPLY
jgi:hypothetical protein